MLQTHQAAILTLHPHSGPFAELARASPDGYFDPILAVRCIENFTATDRTFERPKNRSKQNGRTFGFMPREASAVKVRFKQPAALLCDGTGLERWPEADSTARWQSGLQFTATSQPEVIS